jgi:CheY-like chemotaxis protein
MARILLVEDEPDLRFLLRFFFEGAGHSIVEAQNGVGALACVLASVPDLIVTDMMMPVMDGPELIRRLRSDAATAGIPILAITGSPTLAASADAVVKKPCHGNDVVAAAEGLLNTSETETA